MISSAERRRSEPRRYRRLAFLLSEDREERLTAELWRHGTLGLQVTSAEGHGAVRIDAFFAGDAQLPSLRLPGVTLVSSTELVERDWLAAYRAAAQPFDVGRSFRIDPREPVAERPEAEASGARGRIVLRLPASTAFGTGTHETTRLVLEWLEDLPVSGGAILDVGTGSGILALAAARLGARRVVALDVDPAAVVVAAGNAARHQVELALFGGRPDALRGERRFDLALVNVLPERILPDLAAVRAALLPGGRLVSSGSLTSRRDEVRDALGGLGYRVLAERRLGEWVAFLAER